MASPQARHFLAPALAPLVLFGARSRAIAAVLLFTPALAHADFFSSSPGPLTRAHEHIDGKDHCQDCHVGSRDLANEKCLGCHKPIAERQRERVGVHASQKAQGKPCQLCHTDHKGKSKDILGWQVFGGREKLDHNALTPFSLDGKHAAVKCDSCHTQKTSTGFRTYLKAPRDCAGCHQNPHGDLRDSLRRCERCHDARNWRMLPNAQFDHDRDTRFPWDKKHENLQCVQCHSKKSEPPVAKAAPPSPVGAYQKLTFRWPTWSIDCTPCHANVHGDSLFGHKACKLCHSARVDWPKVNFDHNRRTRFPLDGAHAKSKCESCHTKNDKKSPARACQACHEDKHKSRFDKAGDCAVCHTAANWETDLKFDHTARTKFPLTGAHANADCRACHRGKDPTEWERFDSLMKKGGRVACMSCHQHGNVHQKQYSDDKCLDCHKMAGIVETRPRAVNEFHGPDSRFPLIEGHKGVPCGKCHPNNLFTNAPVQCGPACHPDELHKGTLGKDCLSCHTGGKWEARLFDHDTKTRWPLVGNHKDVLCEGCHPRRDFANNRGRGTNCVNCHEKDDVHHGALGRFCERCHNPDGKLFFDHNNRKTSDWPLEGAHKKIACADCHTTIRFKPTPRDCGPCHPEPDVHRGQLGTLCAVCHDAIAWNRIRTGHDVPTPKFGGAHDGIACSKCHIKGRLLAGTSQLCITCHRGDDVHHNALGPRCGECHTQRTWAAARFEHNRVGCDLTGVHRLLPCVDCHVGGNYNALAPECGACHRKDAIRGAPAAAAAGVPNHQNLTTCASCHNPNFFGPTATPSMRESVCR